MSSPAIGIWVGVGERMGDSINEKSRLLSALMVNERRARSTRSRKLRVRFFLSGSASAIMFSGATGVAVAQSTVTSFPVPLLSLLVDTTEGVVLLLYSGETEYLLVGDSKGCNVLARWCCFPRILG